MKNRSAVRSSIVQEGSPGGC